MNYICLQLDSVVAARSDVDIGATFSAFFCSERPTGSETTPPYAPRSSRFGSEPPSVEDVDVWRYAIVSYMLETTTTTAHQLVPCCCAYDWSDNWWDNYTIIIKLNEIAWTIHLFRILQEAQLSLTNCAMLVCKVCEVWQDFLSEYEDKKFTYICYRRLIRHEWIYYRSKNCVIYNS